VWSGGAAGVALGARDQYCDVAATVAEGFDLDPFPIGTSFLRDITDRHS
jgi:phosphopentomutase